MAPNPFRTLTKFTSGPGRAVPPVLSIHDASGRLLRTLVRDVSGEADRSLGWDGRDGQGRRLPPGPYFYRGDSRPEEIRGKVVLLP